jgi:O-antigen/teichoic acid export membrane protein
MRVKYSLLNITAGLTNQILITSLSFFSRTIFIGVLGIEYLGINGLFTNIFMMLSLAEAGIGSSIIYSLYKPVADNDHEKINVLMKLYRNAYLIIALIITVLGLSLLPFLDLFIKNSSVENVQFIYLIFLLNTVAPYLFLHKNSFLNVCQKGYIVTMIYSVSTLLTTGLKIGILYFTGNYIMYLIIDSILIIFTTIFLASKVDKMYPFLRNKVTTKLDFETKNNIIRNVKAIILQNIGGFLVLGTDNIIISSFVSVAAVGLYSNYSMLIDICRNFSYQISNNIHHSVGNLVAKETKEKIYSVFKVSMLSNFWLYSFFSIALYIMIGPFITIWIGKQFVMSQLVLIVLLLIFFERGMRNSITMVKNTAGIYHEDRFAPLIQAAINLVVSIVLVKMMGIAGVFIGTLISVLVLPFWLTPYLAYKKVFELNVRSYFVKYVLYTAIGLGTCVITSYVCSYLPFENISSLFLKGLACLIIPNIIYILVFFRTEEFQYLLGVLKRILGALLSRVGFIKKLNKDMNY